MAGRTLSLPSLIALLIASVVAHCEESIVWRWCMEAPVIGTHPLGHSGGPACYGDLSLFSLGCAHQGGGPRYQRVLSMRTVLTSIVADAGDSASCGKALN